MRGFNFIIGVIIAVLGFAGLGFALWQMMTYADPNSAIKAIAGISTYLAACFLTLATLR